MKKTLLLFVALFATMTISAQFTVNDIEYTVISGTDVEVTGSSLTTINIPAQVMDSGTTYDVIAIGVDAFRDNTTITSLTLPSSLTTIGNHAFNGCSSLAAAPLDLTNVTSIGDYAFLNCGLITSVIIPEGISFGAGVLRATGLTAINIPASWTTLPVQMVRDCLSIESIIIPSTVTTFGTAAFRGCTNLTAMQIDGTSVISLENTNAIATLPSTCILYVPNTATETAYEADATWTTYFDASRIVVGTLSTNSFDKLEVNLYPNPAKDIVTIKNSTQESMNISVYSLTGKELLTTTASQVNISGLAAGVYLFKVETNEGVGIKRVIKQ